jgi:hypothetical protein
LFPLLNSFFVRVGKAGIEHSLPRCPLLLNHQSVRPTEEDLGGKVPPQFAAKWTLDRDGLKWKFIPTRRHIAAAPFTGNNEGLAA